MTNSHTHEDWKVSRLLATILAILLSAFIAISNSPAQETEEAKPATTSNPEIPLAELDWRLRPLTAAELETEVNGWENLLKQKVEEISKKNIQILEMNRNQKENADTTGAKKTQVLDDLAKLNEERTALLDRAKLVLNAFESKGGDEAKVESHRTYMNAAGGVKVDVSDTEALWSAIKSWVVSEQGGLRWLKNLGLFLVTIIAFYFLGRILSNGVDHALGRARGASNLLRAFLVTSVRRMTLVVGVIVGLAALGVNIGPLLAIIGAAGFVVAFALQNSLGNFASGILIMIFRPFDVGDAVELAGVSGKVEVVNLLSTQLKTFDNRNVIIPNNEVWGGVITNINASDQRRVDMVFGVGYDDDIDQAQRILEDIVHNHELVLKDPEPTIRMNELADSSVNFIVRPWTKTEDYWTVYWDITREVKKRFDEEGITIPFPQSDVHYYNMSASTTEEGRQS